MSSFFQTSLRSRKAVIQTKAYHRGACESIFKQCASRRHLDIDRSSSPLSNVIGHSYFRYRTHCVVDQVSGKHSFRTMTTKSTQNSRSEKDTKAITTLRFYRILQRLCGSLTPTSEGSIIIQNDITSSDWGHYHFHDNGSVFVGENQSKDVLQFLLFLCDEDYKKIIHDNTDTNTNTKICWTTPKNLRDAVRSAFRSSSLHVHQPSDLIREIPICVEADKIASSLRREKREPTPEETDKIAKAEAVRDVLIQVDAFDQSPFSPKELQALAVRAIKIIQDQVKLWNQTSISISQNGLVRVTATSRFLGSVSSMKIISTDSSLSPKYRFAYRICVENISSTETVQLLGRYWHIEENTPCDGSGNSSEPIEVEAPYTGAVGQLPVLQPGQVFEYVSGTDLTTPRGTMKGHLYMAKVPHKTQSARSGDNVKALMEYGSNRATKSPSSETHDDDCNQTKLFQAVVKPFKLEVEEHRC